MLFNYNMHRLIWCACISIWKTPWVWLMVEKGAIKCAIYLLILTDRQHRFDVDDDLSHRQGQGEEWRSYLRYWARPRQSINLFYHWSQLWESHQCQGAWLRDLESNKSYCECFLKLDMLNSLLCVVCYAPKLHSYVLRLLYLVVTVWLFAHICLSTTEHSSFFSV